MGWPLSARWRGAPFLSNQLSANLFVQLSWVQYIWVQTLDMATLSGRGFILYLIALVLLILLAVLFTGPMGNFPIGDDWQYSYPVKTWLEDGKMEYKGIFAPNILLQVVWGYLFCKIAGGFDFTWLRFSTLMAAFIGSFYFYKILQLIEVNKINSLLIVALLFFSPLYYYLSFTFFTDISFLCLCIISIYFFIKFILKKDHISLMLAVFWATASFYIRQPGLLFIPTFAMFVFWENRFSNKSLKLVIPLFLVAFAVYFSLEKWLKPALSISDNFVPVGGQFYTALIGQPIATFIEWIKKGIKTFIYLGFFGLPLLPFYWTKIKALKIINKRTAVVVFILNTILFLLLFYAGKTFPFGGNIMFNFGLGSELLADVYTLELLNTPKAPAWSMLAIQFISQLSATFLFLFIIEKTNTLSGNKKKITVFLLLLNTIYLPVMSITSFFDRYLLLTIVSFFTVLSFFSEQLDFRRPALKFIPAILLTAFSIVATADFMDWNRAKHQAFLYLQEKGISIQEMDAGYEYNGFYNYHFPRQEKEGRSFWWVTDDRYLIAFGPVKGYRTLASFPYFRCLFFRQDAIRVLEREQ